MGFDVVLFVPTGYQTIGQYLTDEFPVEHRVGTFMYDLRVPAQEELTSPKGRSWLGGILRRGR